MSAIKIRTKAGLLRRLLRLGAVAAVVLLSATTVLATLQRTSPAGGAHHVKRGAAISAEFSSAVSNADSTNFFVRGRHSGLHTGTYSGNGSARLTFQSNQPFRGGERVDVTMTTGISGLNQQKQFSFLARANRSTGTVENDILGSVWVDASIGYALPGRLTAGYSGYYYGSACGDINGDGRPDVAVGGAFSPSGVHVWLTPSNLSNWNAMQGHRDFVASKITLTPSTNGTVYGVEIGDINADGYGDVLLSLENGSDNRPELFTWNPQTSAFNSPVKFGTNTGHTGIRTADLNSDGLLDVVCVCHANYYCLNNGQGGFNASVAFTGSGSWGSDVAFADFDNDGDLDVVFVHGSGTVNPNDMVFYNNGTGGFPTSATLGTATVSLGVATGDFNGDGAVDIAVSTYSDGVRLYLNNGAGQFSTSSTAFTIMNTATPPAAVAIGALAAGDLDGDGDLDMALGAGDAGSTGQSKLIFNNGDGTFTTSADLGPANGGGTWGPDIQLVDLDGDGDLDVFWGHWSRGPAYLLNGARMYDDSNDTWTYEHTGFDPSLTGTSPTAHSVSVARTANVAASFNRSMLGASASTVSARGSLRGAIAGSYLGNGTSTLTLNPTLDFKPGEVIELSVRGLNSQDSITDYTTSTVSHTTNQPLVRGEVVRFRAAASAGPLEFSHKVQDLQAATLNTNASVTGDLNGDGTLEVVLGVGNGRDRWFTVGNATGNDVSTSSLDTRALALGDMDNDGDLDLVIGVHGAANVIHPWTGSGFGSATTFGSATDNTHAVALGDLNADGWLDIVCANNGQQNGIYLNNQAGGFTVVSFGAATDNSVAVALADVDRDGDLDIMIGNSGQADVVYLNDGRGAVNGRRSIAGGGNDTRAVAADDLNGDGYPDIVCAYHGGVDNLFLNNGAGDFASNYPLTTAATDSRALTLGDMDGDGDLDVMVGYAAAQGQLLLNNGAGSFTAGASFGPTAGNTSSLLAADFDNDNDLDILFTRPGAQDQVAYNEQWPTAAFSQSQFTVQESAGTATITVTLSSSPIQAVTVNWAATAGTAGAADFNANNGTLTFNPGQTSRTFNVTILNDTLDETDETIVLTLSNPTAALLATGATATLSILDDDGEPTVRFNTATQTVAEGSNIQVTVELSNASGYTVTVAYATTDGTATSPLDYTSNAGTLTIPAGQLTATFTLVTAADNIHETDHSLSIALSNPANAQLGALATTTVTIVDDDAVPTVAITPVATTVGEDGGTVTLTVNLSNPSAFAASVDYATINVSADGASDFTATSGTLAFAPGQVSKTITVSIHDDTLNEIDETFQVALSNPVNCVLGTDVTSVVTITADPDDVFMPVAGGGTGGGGGGGCRVETGGPVGLVGMLILLAGIAVYRRRRIA
ncbi:MAG: VCBS repeat-containing protein [Planctomycetes bacterium]|nr:VCBS repeat-containing protein [Planctomycetota bacterium]